MLLPIQAVVSCLLRQALHLAELPPANRCVQSVILSTCCVWPQSTYTGVYARGGPSNVEPSNELSALLDRSPADIRGVKYNGSPGEATD